MTPQPSQSEAKTGALPGSLRVARVLLIVRGSPVFRDRLHALAVAAGLPAAAGLWALGRPIMLALIGGGFATLDVVCFISLKRPSRRIWWTALGVIPLATLHIASLIAFIPEEAVDLPLVIDGYLVSGVTLVHRCRATDKKARRYARSA